MRYKATMLRDGEPIRPAYRYEGGGYPATDMASAAD
jgi:hypothetical protein